MNRTERFLRLKSLLLFPILLLTLHINASEYKFYFGKNTKQGYQTVDNSIIFGDKSKFGYDLNTVPKGNNPYFFSVNLPEGNYRVTVVLGNKDESTITTVRAESRRLMLENVETDRGEFVTRSFIVNIRNTKIGDSDSVKIKKREIGKLDWDDKLTLEINGKKPGLVEMVIEDVNVPTLFLAGNSTVVDQDEEPWCAWGQILPRFLKPQIAVANYAESGEAANTFIASKRLAKLLTKMQKGDYLFIEFGHNDQKQKGENIGPYTSFKKNLKYFIDETRKKGGIPVLVTPVNRRNFDETGHIINTLGDYPDAMKQLAKEENVMLIDLNGMSKILYEAWGPDESIHAFVHYPAGTFPHQDQPLADNTHFNTYGAYEICKCVLKGILNSKLPLNKYIVEEAKSFDPRHPDSWKTFNIPPSPFYSIQKPDGN
jgi:lysophospholipase L1-like esterase